MARQIEAGMLVSRKLNILLNLNRISQSSNNFVSTVLQKFKQIIALSTG